MKARALITAAVAIAIGAGCAQASESSFDVGGPKAERGRMVSVTDGDTLRIRVGRRTERVRVLGIDTPETRRPGVRVECGGPQATAYMRRYAPPRARVTVTTDPTQDRRDRYGRLLAYVDVKGKGDAGAAMVHKGWAKPYVYQGKPVHRHSLYASLARSASRVGRGVWGRCDGDFHREL